MYDFKCEYCSGTVRERRVDREVFNHPSGVAILENVPIGICDQCQAHYYSAAVLKRVESVIAGTAPSTHTEQVPVARF
jgi:YgiT-type zinc finger domain-containing protein